MSTNQQDNLHELLEEVAKEYAEIFNINTELEKKKISDQIATVLLQLEQHNKLLDETARVNRDVLQKQLPKIFSHYQALQQQFAALDALGCLVQRVSCDVTRLEAAVTAAEQQVLGQQPTLTHRILQPVIRKLEPEVCNGRSHLPAYDPSLIFNPTDHLAAFSIGTGSSRPVQPSTDTSASNANNNGSSGPTSSRHVDQSHEALCLNALAKLNMKNSTENEPGAAQQVQNTSSLRRSELYGSSEHLPLDNEEINVT